MGRTASSNFVQKMEDGTFWYEETPVGSINGVNKTFTLTEAPNPASSLELLVNQGDVVSAEDYSISGDTITTIIAYPTGTILRARYRVEPS